MRTTRRTALALLGAISFTRLGHAMTSNSNPAQSFKGHRVVFRHQMEIQGSPDAVFPLLCPVREGEWADGWVGRPIYAASGVAELNGVYATEHEGEAQSTIWVVTKHDPERREITLVYFVSEKQVVHLDMRVTANGAVGSKLHIEYVRTGISAAGNEQLRNDTNAGRFDEMMKGWKAAMNHFLATGTILK